LRAKLLFAYPEEQRTESRLLLKQEFHRILKKHEDYIDTSVWQGLPELTNANGEFCPFRYLFA
jgi:hypothetical protein